MTQKVVKSVQKVCSKTLLLVLLSFFSGSTVTVDEPSHRTVATLWGSNTITACIVATSYSTVSTQVKYVGNLSRTTGQFDVLMFGKVPGFTRSRKSVPRFHVSIMVLICLLVHYHTIEKVSPSEFGHITVQSSGRREFDPSPGAHTQPSAQVRIAIPPPILVPH